MRRATEKVVDANYLQDDKLGQWLSSSSNNLSRDRKAILVYQHAKYLLDHVFYAEPVVLPSEKGDK